MPAILREMLHLDRSDFLAYGRRGKGFHTSQCATIIIGRGQLLFAQTQPIGNGTFRRHDSQLRV